MNALYQNLRTKNPKGLPYDEALQLFLWIYCTTDFLPQSLRRDPIGKEVLEDAFEKLTSEGLILSSPSPETIDVNTAQRTPRWAGVIEALLSNRVELDPTFPNRAHNYMRYP